MEQNQTYKDRAAVGKFSGIVGIICNFLLALGKLIAGSLAFSMSVTADGLNNLSDAASSVVTLIGFKLAEKPADKEHPYGHARFEYLASLTVSAMILVIGFELAKSSVIKIINPKPIEFSAFIVCVLAVSILVKAWMTLFYSKMGKKINSSALAAAALDSRNDVITTSAVLAAALAERFFNIQIDSFMGIAVSLFILYSGLELAKKTISPLIGERTNPELKKQLTEYIMECPTVLGCHDLMVHDYGPGRRYASIHVEIDKNEDAVKCHEIIDGIERGCLKKYGIHLVIHYDPIVTDDSEMNRVHKLVSTILKMRDRRLSIHDFRMHKDEKNIKLTFDMVLPGELQKQGESIKNSLEEALNSLDENKYQTDITFDIDTNDD